MDSALFPVPAGVVAVTSSTQVPAKAAVKVVAASAGRENRPQPAGREFQAHAAGPEKAQRADSSPTTIEFTDETTVRAASGRIVARTCAVSPAFTSTKALASPQRASAERTAIDTLRVPGAVARVPRNVPSADRLARGMGTPATTAVAVSERGDAPPASTRASMAR